MAGVTRLEVPIMIKRVGEPTLALRSFIHKFNSHRVPRERERERARGESHSDRRRRKDRLDPVHDTHASFVASRVTPSCRDQASRPPILSVFPRLASWGSPPPRCRTVQLVTRWQHLVGDGGKQGWLVASKRRGILVSFGITSCV